VQALHFGLLYELETSRDDWWPAPLEIKQWSKVHLNCDYCMDLPMLGLSTCVQRRIGEEAKDIGQFNLYKTMVDQFLEGLNWRMLLTNMRIWSAFLDALVEYFKTILNAFFRETLDRMLNTLWRSSLKTSRSMVEGL